MQMLYLKADMTKYEEHVARVRKRTLEDVLTTDSGHKAWWPVNMGYFTADDFRIMADYLDELNKDWDAQLEQDLNASN
jgi:hypothetical protein